MTHDTNDTHDDVANVPNHHANFPGFAGIRGWLGAQSMRHGRADAAELAIDLTKLVAGDRVVDIGCGPGVATRIAADRGASAIGIDPAEVMLTTAEKDDRGRTVRWLQGTAEALPLPDDCCDVAWALSTVHHWRDLEQSLRDVRRVLTDRGRFLATERRVKQGATGHASHGWTQPQAEVFADLCASAGFDAVAVSAHPTGRGTVLAVLARG